MDRLPSGQNNPQSFRKIGNIFGRTGSENILFLTKKFTHENIPFFQNNHGPDGGVSSIHCYILW